jgi:outer membrane protein assembly factor BamE (lipoprotein component of BamABCDE complex)
VSAAAAAAILLLASLAACGPSEEERTATARAEAWVELEEAQAALNAKRSDLEQLRAQAAAPGEGEDAEALAAQAEALDGEVGADGEAFSQKLVNYINEAGWDLGGEFNEEQRAAFAMKSGEDMYLAQEYAVKGGDYRRAIEILQRAQGVDPDNPDVAARIAEYQEARYVTVEQLAEVKRGMTEAEVESVLGKVFHSYVRNFPDEKVFAWFYPKDPEEHGAGAAVGVFFNESDRKVYRTDPNAVEGKDEEE